MSFRGVVSIALVLIAALALTGVAVAQNPVPLINQPLAPDAAKPGGAGFTLTVNGTGFVSTSVVKWNGSARTTTFVSDSQLKAKILASDIAKPGTASITAVSPGPGGGPSNTIFFPVSLPANLRFGAVTFPAGTHPGSVATADLNKDGKLDLVVPDTGSGTVSVLLGNGDGTFKAPITYTVGHGRNFQFFQVAIGDLNGDGNPDFVVSDFDDNYVSVFLGNGDGTFKSGMIYAVGTHPTDVVVADLNGDGKLDLAVTNQNSSNNGYLPGTVSVLLGNGDGTFQSHIDFDTGQDPNWVTVGDFNGDGKLDLAVIDGQGNAYTSAVVILLGKGDGTFQMTGTYPLSTNGVSGTAADFNGDGKLDLAVADNIGLLSIFLGNGDGTFQPRVNYRSGSFPFGSFAVGDFNQDNNIDIAVATFGSNAVALYLGNGDGTFQAPMQVSTGSVPRGVAAGGFTRSGRLDLAVANNDDNTVSILLQSGTVSLSPATLNFGVLVVGTEATKHVTLTNTGSTNVVITGITIKGTNVADFTETNNCGSSVSPGAHCTISVNFEPAQPGPATASLTVTDSGPGSPQSVPLSGTGVVLGPNVTLSATSLTFSTQLIGTSSTSQSVTLTNYGTMTLDITNIVASGDFSRSKTCSSSLVPLASCTIAVVFKPTHKGSRTGILSITDNAPDSPQMVSLTGVGTVVRLNNGSLNFGIHPVGTTTTQSTTLTNIGRTALSITSIVIAGADTDEFRQTNTCGTSVGAGKSCTITVTFKPTEAGNDSADVSISDNGGGSPQQVPLSGTGCIFFHGHCKTAPDLRSPALQSALRANSAAALPRPSGSSPVGTQVMDLADATRDDPFLADGTKRELLVRFWYPADLSRGCAPAEYTSPRVWSYFSKLAGLPLPEVTTNSCLEAPITEGAHPVVVFTHGYTATFTDYSFIFEDLASRGYVVASVDHTYEATAVEFPDGRFLKSVLGSHIGNTWRMDDQAMSLALAARSEDLNFIVHELERLNTDASPFTGKLDTSRIGVLGHSLGGEAALSTIEQEVRFSAGVLIDPVLTDTSPAGTDRAILILAAGREQWSEIECRFWDQLRGPRLAVNLRDAEHVTPSDLVWLAKGAVKTGPMGPEKTIAALRDYIAAFLDTNLRGKPLDRLLSGPSPEYPDAVVTTQEQPLCTNVISGATKR
jgi:dienelactone hydrolase